MQPLYIITVSSLFSTCKSKLFHTFGDSSITVSAECKDFVVYFHSFAIEYSGTLYNGHHSGSQPFVPHSKVSLTQALLGIFLVGAVYIIRLFSTTWLRFQNFLLLYTSRERQSSLASSTNQIQEVMVDNFAQKVNECPLNQGQVSFASNLDVKLSVVSSSRVFTIQGLLKY